MKIKSTALYNEKDAFWGYSSGRAGAKFQIKGTKLRKFLNAKLGIWVFKEGGHQNYGEDEIFVKIDNGIIDVIDEREVNRLLRLTIENHKLWKGIDEDTLDDVFDELIGVSDNKVKNIIKTLPVLGEDITYFRDTKTKSYILFASKVRGEEIVVEITTTDIRKMHFKDLPRDVQKKLVWRNQFIKLPDAKNILRGKRAFKLHIATDKEWKKIDAKKGDWNKYIRAICSFPVRDSENNIVDSDTVIKK